MLIGVAIFLLGDWLVDRRFGTAGAGGAMGIVVGSVVDGAPESVIFGIQIGTGVDQCGAFSPRCSSRTSRRRSRRPPTSRRAAGGTKLGTLWLLVVLACGVAAALGFLADRVRPAYGERAAALAAGGLLAMLTNSLMPFAFERGEQLAGPGHRRGLLPHAAQHLSFRLHRLWAGSGGPVCGVKVVAPPDQEKSPCRSRSGVSST